VIEEEAPKLTGHKNLISSKGIGPVGARLSSWPVQTGHYRKIE